ncbi:hypothetical protein, partial [Kaarinaea lacus]
MSGAPSIDTALEGIPPVLQDGVRHHWDRFIEAKGEPGLSVSDDSDFLAGLCRVWACSEFAAQLCTRQPDMLVGLLESGDLLRGYAPGDY